MKNRLHLDLVSADAEAEVTRLIAVGARLEDRHEDHWVPADPEGYEFCLYPTAP